VSSDFIVNDCKPYLIVLLPLILLFILICVSQIALNENYYTIKPSHMGNDASRYLIDGNGVVALLVVAILCRLFRAIEVMSGV
jgi:hypothetical protein